MADHIRINRYERELERRRRIAHHGSGRRDNRTSFTEVQRSNINEILAEHEQKKLIFSHYFDPNLIFRIKVIGHPDEASFADFLRRCDLHYISPSPASAISDGELSYRVSHAERDNLDEIKRRLERYNDTERYRGFFQIIESIESIPPEDKIGKGLLQSQLSNEIAEFVDIELWRMEPSRLDSAKTGLINYITEHGGEITDQITTRSFCLLRGKITKQILDEILKLSEISVIDRPPKVSFFRPHELAVPVEEIDTGSPPSAEASAIIVLDSGVLSGHPLLENCIGDEIEGASLIDSRTFPNDFVDDVGHGTKVSGIALYGDLKRCSDNRRFNPEFFLLSGKVLYRQEDEETGLVYAGFDDRITIESLINVTINYFCDHYTTTKVVNISFVTEKETFNLRQQHRVSSLIDELAMEKELIFVISAGNISSPIIPERYPQYLLENTPHVKIIEPASSAYALTVGSIAQEYLPENVQGLFFPNHEWPSLFTSVGPGLNGMVKPELVEEGGNEPFSDDIRSLQNGVFVLNPRWRDESSLLTTDCGTSYSAPRITHYIARLCNRYPAFNMNTIKALLISSSHYPDDRPEPLNVDINNADPDQRTNLLNVYGYGKPNIDYAESSENNHVCFIAEDSISIDGVHFYELYLPNEFIGQSGNRELSVTLVYNPQIMGTRIDYFGVKVSFILFKNTPVEDLERYSTRLVHDEVVLNEEEMRDFPRIALEPNNNIRSKGLHQKGSIIYRRTPGIDITKPLVLGVFCKGNWMKKEDYLDFKQNYSVVIALKHQATVDLYTRIIQMIRARIRI